MSYVPCLKIFKYGFFGNRVSVELPAEARPLSFAWQDKAPVGFQLWILFDTADEVRTPRHFRYFVTGLEEVIEPMAFIGTAQAFDGKFVAHCFEVETGG